ncbi:MAG: bacterioferritin [Actinomycetota bacterium]
MEGDERVIDVLNDVLTAELTAINQYFVHAKMCADWGFGKLADYTRDESIDEMKHAESLIDRILFLDGHPNLQRLGTLAIGETVPEQLQADLDLEYRAVERLRQGVVACTEAVDHTSRQLLEDILESEEEHIDWLEAQLSLIADVGLENYLSQQISTED